MTLRLTSYWALRLSLAVIYLWFGLLKAIGHSPAEELAARTLGTLSLGLVPAVWNHALLVLMEAGIGLLLLLPRTNGLLRVLLPMHIAGTFLPLLLFPAECFSQWFVPTLLGQYVLKNLVMASAAYAICTCCTSVAGSLFGRQRRNLAHSCDQTIASAPA